MPSKGKGKGRGQVPREFQGIPFEKGMEDAAPRPSPSDPSGPTNPSDPRGEKPTMGPVNQAFEKSRRLALDKDGERSRGDQSPPGRKK